MSNELERRWDDAVETAWREFRQRLADRMFEMAEDDSLVVEVTDEVVGGSAPYCQVLAGPGVLRVEAVSNEYLAEQFELDAEQERALVALDFCPPEVTEWGNVETNFHVDVEQREADRVAVMVVRALREVYAVVHPAWLAADGLEPTFTPAEAPPVEVDRPVSPTSVAEVQAAIDLAIAGMYAEAPEWDEDDDLPLPTERCTVWAVVSSKGPRVLLHCTLIDGIENLDAVMAEVNRLNRAEFGLTFFVADEQRVAVTREIGLDAVVPSSLRAEIDRLVGKVDEWAAAMEEVAATERKRAIPPKPTRFTTAWSVMVELEREERGSVGPATLVRIFENDTGLLIKAIRINEQRRREMRLKLRDAQKGGHRRTEKLARARVDYLRELTARMRAALRLIVDAPVRKVQLDQLALFDEDDCGTGR
ncbi:TY-Chap domain-containing protein [Nocardioides currus]|uniref:YbjN domain-containing protein n=1 Tax=Nocardioides currus TaxID=2133958 RepID=A0A2R7Z2I8_9ACTN|nr:hypothetical protein [Nocardioides currus]PUA82456.1 hypothetical protein C7S10_01505 [Nocardioides currus]